MNQSLTWPVILDKKTDRHRKWPNIRRLLKHMSIAILVLTVLLGLAAFLFLQQPRFGKMPSGERLARIKQSPHYANGQFHNLVPRPDLTEGVSKFSIYWDFFFAPKVRTEPAGRIPSMKTNLLNLDSSEDMLVWFGHSSYFMQIDGKKLLVDPVLGAWAAPVSFMVRAFEGTNRYSADDLPEIDYLFVTHDHWDHLDYETILALKNKVGKIFCGLGVGEHLEYWGVDPEKIIETDWGETTRLDNGFTVHTMNTHHFSGRDLRRDRTLWVSYVLETDTGKFYFGGDSGYGPHFAEIGKRFGPFDLVILENGQYNKNWKYSHMQPEEVLQAAKDLQAQSLFPVHSGKFVISMHPWDEPLRRITSLNKKNAQSGSRLLTPLIGEAVKLKDSSQVFTSWWENVE